mgnify:CR=1 FL=1
MKQAYTQREIIIPASRVGREALRIVGPMVLVYLILYAILWPQHFTLQAFTDAFPDNPLVILALLAGGIILHEGLHGATWALFTKKGFRSIRFGFMLRLLAPYCHCTEPLKRNVYILGGLMPGVVMGMIPAVYALLEGSMGWLIFAIFFTVAAGGDFAMMRLLRKVHRKSLLKDHPSELGCYIYDLPGQGSDKG